MKKMEQRTSPCAECPFARHCPPGALGGSRPEVYVGQIHLPFWLPCHCDKNYQGKASDVNAVEQCAGAAIMRANLHVPPARGLLQLPPDETKVFGSIAEFYAHHSGCSVEGAEQYLTPEKIKRCMEIEWNNVNVRLQLKRMQA